MLLLYYLGVTICTGKALLLTSLVIQGGTGSLNAIGYTNCSQHSNIANIDDNRHLCLLRTDLIFPSLLSSTETTPYVLLG